DMGRLAEGFLRMRCRELGRNDLELSEGDRRLLTAYSWPGNVRELQHVIERAVILSPRPPLRLDRALAGVSMVPASHIEQLGGPARDTLLREEDLLTLERENLLAALRKTGGRIAGPGGAADLLKMRPSTLRDRMRSLGIARERWGAWAGIPAARATSMPEPTAPPAPLADAVGPAAGRDRSPSAASPRPDTSGTKVLVLDDDPDLRAALRDVLRALCGRECVEARSVDDLIAQASDALDCDVAILDINLG